MRQSFDNSEGEDGRTSSSKKYSQAATPSNKATPNSRAYSQHSSEPKRTKPDSNDAFSSPKRQVNRAFLFIFQQITQKSNSLAARRETILKKSAQKRETSLQIRCWRTLVSRMSNSTRGRLIIERTISTKERC